MLTVKSSSTIQSEEGKVFGKSKPEISRVASSVSEILIVQEAVLLKYKPVLVALTTATSYS
ncbi:MAG: hypothetical protein LBD88_00515 [Candidatus Peribacteria bacterium]|jgi:hypothetical protein|nr:hypothetical protein [Candidatus Peribacteria bacterium]